MEGVSESLRFPVIVEGRTSFSLEPQLLEELDFLLRYISAEGRAVKEFSKSRLFLKGLVGFCFHELKFAGLPWGYSPVQDDFYAKSRQINIPGFNQRIQEGVAILQRHVEDIRIQEVEHDDPHLFIAPVAQSSHQAEPVFALQFLLDNSLGHVQKLLRDQASEFAERLLLENRADFLLLAGCALAEDQISNFFKSAGRSPIFFFNSSLRCRSANFTSSARGSFRKSPVLS